MMNRINSIWIKLSELGLNEKEISSLHSRSILNCNKFAMVIGMILLQNILFHAYCEIFIYAFLELFLLLFLFPVFLLNKFSYFNAASIYLMLYCNIEIFLFDSITGKDARNYIYYINIILLNFFVFKYSQKFLILINFLTTSLLVICLELTNYSLFLGRASTILDRQYLFLIAIISSGTLMLFSIYNIISNYSKIEDTVKDEEKLLKSIFNFSPLGIAVLTRERKIKSFNTNLRNNLSKLTNLEIQQGEDFIRYLPEREHLNFANYFNLTLEGRIIRIEKNFKIDYISLWFDILLSPIMLNKEICSSIVLTFVDITDRKQLEINAHFAREKAEMANIAKSQFLSTMGNEIRTPMNEVIEITKSLIEVNPREDQIANLNQLKSSTQNLVDLINDILDYEIIEASTVQSSQIEFDFFSTFLFVRDFYKNKINKKGLDFKYFVDEKIPQILIGDPVRLRQVIMHLLNNSIKFTGKGNIIFRADLTFQNDNYLTILFSILDTGYGIATKKLEKIIQDFNGLDLHSNRSFGLGFTITKKLLELLDSKLMIESEIGIGSKFSFSVNFYLPSLYEEFSPHILGTN